MRWLPPREGFGYQAALVDAGSEEAAAELLSRQGERFAGRAIGVARPMQSGAGAGEVALDWPRLYEKPDASINFLQAAYLTHREKLAQCPTGWTRPPEARASAPPVRARGGPS